MSEFDAARKYYEMVSSEPATHAGPIDFRTACGHLARVLKAFDALTAENANLREATEGMKEGAAIRIRDVEAERDAARAECERLTVENERLWKVEERRNLKIEEDAATLAGLRAGGAGLIAAERERQQSVERWTPDHDDAHSRMEMVDAAVCYLRFGNIGMQGYPPHAWPWEASWWKPSDPIRNLVKAGALIAAEIDRLQREAAARAALERTDG